jgi:hypothetical protein
VTDIRELIRRLQRGEPDRRIARDLAVSRNTVARYRQWATDQGFLAAGAPLPEPAALAARLEPVPTERPAQEQSLVEPYRERVKTLLEAGVEGQAIWQLLVDEHDFVGSYSSVKRFLRRLVPPEVRATLRLEVDPGTEAQVDFGYGGQFVDPDGGDLRRAWVFVMTLSCSRHQYAELVFDQTLATWVRLHRAAFEFFGGVPPARRPRQSAGRDRPRGAVRSRGPAQLPPLRRALWLPDRAVPSADAPAQGEGRTRWRPLRQAQRAGRPHVPRPPGR